MKDWRGTGNVEQARYLDIDVAYIAAKLFLIIIGPTLHVLEKHHCLHRYPFLIYNFLFLTLYW